MRLHHIAIIASDYQRSKQFYTSVLGLRVIRETFRRDRNSYKLDLAFEPMPKPELEPVLDPPPAHSNVGGVQIELFSFPDPPARVTNPEACGLRHLAFAVTDIESEVTRLAALGVECEPIRTDELTGQRFTFFRDPDDLPLELYESPAP